MDEQLYQIQEGMRRAKAAWLCGHETIAATIGGIGDIIQVPVKSLRSPKTRIEDIGPRGGRWGVIYRMTQRGYRQMNSNFLDSGIRALHKVIVCTRLLGYNNADPQLIARVLNHADALGFMLMADFRDFEGEETPVLFRRHLRGIEDAFSGFNGLVARFDENMKRGKAKPEQPRELAAASA